MENFPVLVGGCGDCNPGVTGDACIGCRENEDNPLRWEWTWILDDPFTAQMDLVLLTFGLHLDPYVSKNPFDFSVTTDHLARVMDVFKTWGVFWPQEGEFSVSFEEFKATIKKRRLFEEKWDTRAWRRRGLLNKKQAKQLKEFVAEMQEISI